jgi:hypothetical protein
MKQHLSNNPRGSEKSLRGTLYRYLVQMLYLYILKLNVSDRVWYTMRVEKSL